MEQTIIYLGAFTGISKKNDRAYWQIFFARPAKGVTGYRAEFVFVDEDQYKTFLKKKALSEVVCDIRYINGSNVLLHVQEN